MSTTESISSRPTIAVIDYGMGNLQSVRNALQAAGAEVSLISTPPKNTETWDGVVLPGVGAMGDCVANLERRQLTGWIREWVAADRPFLGICLGLQALFEYTEEGNSRGLGIFRGTVRQFQLPAQYKIPHMGWNSLHIEQPSALLEGLHSQRDQVYFVHSYYVCPEDESLILTTTDYGIRFTSAIQKGRCFATQFHPEKSQFVGRRIFQNFLKTTQSHP